MDVRKYALEGAELLSRLIATPSVSRDEAAAADVLFKQMEEWGLNPKREGNNVWAISPDFDPQRKTILLNAHIDTVKPVATWTRDPFKPTWEGDKLYGLGSNDCGGGLVSLLQAYRILINEDSSVECRVESGEFATAPEGSGEWRVESAEFATAPQDGSRESLNGLFGDSLNGNNAAVANSTLSTLHSPLVNLVFLASCEEEVSGKDGIVRVLPLLPKIDVAIVGEPTGMQPAIAEKGLMVIDGYAHGVSGHAARNEGVNAIYEALDDLVWLRDYRFEKVSPLLGPTKMTVTVVEAGTQHNVVPDTLHFILDVRPNEFYQNEELYQFLCSKMKHCELKARSFRLHSSSIAEDHPIVQRCLSLGMQPFGSPTLSDQALMSFPSLKLGPGQSSRSHSADEFICLSELEDAIEKYLKILGE
ncbi:M20 family metallo-hydrolase [Prevotella sp. E9-3]|nr:M20 family metallo-hydrolase [Prevotella sp. E9-3]UKK49742.1 M20 family metallo-hydrolase [Prevotella sp. E9-3]